MAYIVPMHVKPKFTYLLHGGTTEEGNCSYPLPLSHHYLASGVSYRMYVVSDLEKNGYLVLAAYLICILLCVHILFLAATKQLYKWYIFRLSVTPFWLCSHHRIIMKFSGFITNDQRMVHAKDPGQRSKVKVTEVTTQLNRFRTVTPVWIHIWWWNDAYSLMLLRRGALLFFKVIRQISRSHGSKNCRIRPRLGVS